jgi:hypothetical protein
VFPVHPGAPPLPIPGCCPRHCCSVPGHRAVRAPPRHPWPPGFFRARRRPRPRRRPQAAAASFTRRRRRAIHSAADGTGTLTVFTNEKGGAIDDSIITKVTDQHIYLVVNAGGRDKDLAHIEAHMEVFNKKGGYVKWHIHDERTLLALQVSAVLLPTCWCSLIALIDDCHT